MPRLLEFHSGGKLDSTIVVTHKRTLDQTVDGHKTFHQKKGECIKAVLKPHGLAA
jgi:threonine dehydrogenase-like Zn-dependent dehydrogenase